MPGYSFPPHEKVYIGWGAILGVDWRIATFLVILFWGLQGVLVKVALRGVDERTFLIIYGIAALALSFFVAPRGEVVRPYVGVALAAALTSILGYLFYLEAVGSGKVSIVVPLTSLSIAVTVILAALFLGERLDTYKEVGIALAMLAVVLLSL